jgi:hypothetical protein
MNSFREDGHGFPWKADWRSLQVRLRFSWDLWGGVSEGGKERETHRFRRGEIWWKKMFMEASIQPSFWSSMGENLKEGFWRGVSQEEGGGGGGGGPSSCQ